MVDQKTMTVLKLLAAQLQGRLRQLDILVEALALVLAALEKDEPMPRAELSALLDALSPEAPDDATH